MFESKQVINESALVDAPEDSMACREVFSLKGHRRPAEVQPTRVDNLGSKATGILSAEETSVELATWSSVRCLKLKPLSDDSLWSLNALGTGTVQLYSLAFNQGRTKIVRV